LSAVPVIVVVVPVEGAAVARLFCASFEDEQRLALDLWQRSVLIEVAAALERLRVVLADEGRAA
jgi:hypothetical protein